MAGLVAFTGLAGSGKTTAAKMLGWPCVKFALPIKFMTAVLLDSAGYSDLTRHVEGDLKETPLDGLGDGVTPRYIMQTLGKEWGRDFIDENIWVKIAERRIIKYMLAGYNVVMDDCRFENEVVAIHALGGTVIEIQNRHGCVGTEHASEKLPTPDMVIDNSGDMSRLKTQLDFIFK